MVWLVVQAMSWMYERYLPEQLLMVTSFQYTGSPIGPPSDYQ